MVEVSSLEEGMSLALVPFVKLEKTDRGAKSWHCGGLAKNVGHRKLQVLQNVQKLVTRASLLLTLNEFALLEL